MQFFTNLGRTLDELISQALRKIRPTRPTPTYTKRPVEPFMEALFPDVAVEPVVKALPPEVTVTLHGESMTAFFLEKKMSPAVSPPVDVTDDTAMGEAIRKSGGVWDPQFSLVDQGEAMDIDMRPLSLQDILQETEPKKVIKKCEGHSWKPHFSMLMCEHCGMQMSPRFLKLKPKNTKGDS